MDPAFDLSRITRHSSPFFVFINIPGYTFIFEGQETGTLSAVPDAATVDTGRRLVCLIPHRHGSILNPEFSP